MFTTRYVLAELRRRRGRTILTALGLGVGVALVVAVTALSQGLADAQDEVLRPLSGVGTDMSMTRPLRPASDAAGGDPFAGLSAAERKQLRDENRPRRLDLTSLGDPGDTFESDNFMSSQLTLPASTTAKISGLDGVREAAGGLTLNAVHVTGVVPEQSQQQGGFGPPAGGVPAAGARPDNLDFSSISVSGVDPTTPTLGAMTEAQVTKGSYLTAGDAREAVLSEGYAKRMGLIVGDEVRLGGKTFEVVGISSPPLGGTAADLYVKLDQLQRLAGRDGRVNAVYVRAASTDDVSRVSREMERLVDGASVTTTEDLAQRVGGSLVDARNLASKLGTALAVVALAAAILIAMLLTLSSVAKRTRELGTLKAIGWKQSRVVRQVSGEALAQGVLGGVVGAALGVGVAAAVGALGLTLEASVASTGAGTAPGPLPGLPGGGFGTGQIVSGTTDVVLHAPVSAQLVLLAVALSILGGLLAGAVGGLRAARLRPADALRNLD
ncbi:MAG: ABC transporter permease [Solirubrobacteraceae bacterium]|nr:ABC transporter permease [Solirubrobacteraceae bacterium]